MIKVFNSVEDFLKNIHGTLTVKKGDKSFLFKSLLTHPGEVENFQTHGVASMQSDGSVEFISKSWPRSNARLISKLSHGRLSKTVSGDYLITIRIPSFEIHPSTIIFSDAVDAMNALDEYIINQREEVAV